MRILLDECVDERLRYQIHGHECVTARYARLTGLKNGELLSAAESAGFDVLIAVDKNIRHQQNMRERKLAVLVLSAPSTRLKDLECMLPVALSAIHDLRQSEIRIIS